MEVTRQKQGCTENCRLMDTLEFMAVVTWSMTSFSLSPSSAAFWRDFEPSGSPTRTSTPESRRLNA